MFSYNIINSLMDPNLSDRIYGKRSQNSLETLFNSLSPEIDLAKFQEEKEVSEFYVPQVVNMSFLVGYNCRNLKKIEEKTNTFLRPKGSHKVSF